MKNKIYQFLTIALVTISFSARAQQNETIFRKSTVRHSGGYAAISNKFTTINGDFANMVGVYGGWFINRQFMIGVGGAATTNYIPAPWNVNQFPGSKMTYQHGQFGLMTEYVFASTKKVHVNVNLMTGAGFTTQYDQNDWDDWDWDDFDERDPNFYFMMEPGVQVEFNLLKWMRFSPGVSYRRAFGASSSGLSDADLSNLSYNLTLKFGAF
ncbi:MAG TPA: hypothetical protein VGN64_05560 [Dyadobacter sp.]|jgi:hypothetical protein|nr:hypothetical protein [Dyadobacter sp.]